MNEINPAYIGMSVAPCVEDAVKEWEYQQSRIRYCKEIIKQKPNTPAARNAQWLIDQIREDLEWKKIAKP